MRTQGHTIRGNDMAGPRLDLRVVREWMQRTFTKERSAEATAGLVVLCYVGIVLAHIFMS
jgi:hypothetical protein